MHRIFLICSLSILLSACASLQQARSSAAQLSSSLYAPNHYMDLDFQTTLAGLNVGEPLDSNSRAFVFNSVSKINYEYVAYLTNITSGKASLNIAYDSVNLGLTGAAAIATPTTTKTGLAALSTFF